MLTVRGILASEDEASTSFAVLFSDLSKKKKKKKSHILKIYKLLKKEMENVALQMFYEEGKSKQHICQNSSIHALVFGGKRTRKLL